MGRCRLRVPRGDTDRDGRWMRRGAEIGFVRGRLSGTTAFLPLQGAARMRFVIRTQNSPMSPPHTPAQETERLQRARAQWRHVGDARSPFAQTPGPGQESVWDYPRPPRIEPDAREVVVRSGEVEIARTRKALRLLETASPPTFYLPRADVRADALVAASGTSYCEWKGEARYLTVVAGGRRFDAAAWFYPQPAPTYAALRDHVAFYPHELACWVDGVRVVPQPGRFYAGWITPEVVGPFKGEPGSAGW